MLVLWRCFWVLLVVGVETGGASRARIIIIIRDLNALLSDRVREMKAF